jgi:hypothetical protein
MNANVSVIPPLKFLFYFKTEHLLIDIYNC